jgi:23S rRNA-/tRNA-specific pseudouridylate synthase
VFSVFDSITLLIEMFLNYSESNAMVFVDKMTSGLMNITKCSEAKSVLTHDLRNRSIAIKNMEILLRYY